MAEEERSSAAGPGRFRRWVLRPVFWGLALIACLIFLLQVTIDTQRVRDWARARLAMELGDALDREVEVRDLHIDLLPFELEIEGLVIGGGPGVDTPFLVIPYAFLEIDLDALRQRRLHLRLLRLERPQIDLRFFPGGADNVPRASSDGSGGAFELWIDQMEIDRASLGLDHRQVPMTVDAERIRTRLRGLGDFRLAGSTLANRVRVRLPEARPIEVSVRAESVIDRGGLKVESARIAHAFGEARVEGECDWRRDRWQSRKCVFEVEGGAEGRMLRELGYFSSLDGAFAFEGTWAWRPGSLGWRGPVWADRVELWGRRVEDLEGHLSADRFGVRLAVADASYVGGRIEGHVGVDARAEGHPLTADLDFTDLHLDALLADQGIGVSGLAARVDGSLIYTCPLARGLRGDGRAEVEIRGDPRAEGLPVSGTFPLRIEKGVIRADAANLRSDRQTLLAAGWYGLRQAHGRFDYEIESLDVAELVPLLSLDGEALPIYLPTAGRGRLHGILDVDRVDVYTRVSLDLEAVETPRTDADGVRGGFDVTPRAIENLRLSLRGPPGHPEASLDLRGRVPFGSEGEVSLEIDADDWPMAQVRPWLDFELPLDGEVTGRLDLRWDAIASIGRLAATLTPARWLGMALEADGLLAELDWDGEGLRLDRLRAVAAAGSLEADGLVRWAPQAPSGEGGEEIAAADTDPAADPELDIEIRSERLDLSAAPLAAWLPRDDLEAFVDVRGHVGGTWAAPMLDLKTRAERLALGGRLLPGPPASLEARWDGRTLSAEGRLLSATLEGGGRLDGEVVDLELDLSADRLGPVLELMARSADGVTGRARGRLRIVGEPGSASAEETESAAGSARASGERLAGMDFDGPEPVVDDPFALSPDIEEGASGIEEGASGIEEVESADAGLGGLRVSLELDELEMAMADRSLRSAGTAVFELDSERIRIGELDLRSPETNSQIFLDGELGWVDQEPLSLAVLADLDLEWLRFLLPDLEPVGRLELDGRLIGTPARPRVEGRGAVSRMALAVPGLDEGFSELAGGIHFHRDRLVLEGLSGRLSGGRVDLSGEVSIVDGPGAVEGRDNVSEKAAEGEPNESTRDPDGEAAPSVGLDYRLELRGRDVRVPYLRGFAMAGDIDMSFRSQSSGQLLSGSARLDRLEYLEDIRFDFAQMMRDFLRGQRLQVESASAAEAGIRLEVRLEAPGTVRLHNNLARLDGSADLVLRGSLAQPVLFGEVVMDPGGELIYNSTDYVVERGRLIFADPYGSRPEVDLVATTEVRDFDITLALAGPLERLDARFSSEPPLPDVEVFRLLAGGETYVDQTELAPDRTAELGEETGRSAANLLYGQAASAIGDRVNSLFGFDKFRIDPLTGSDDNLSKARITVGKRLSKDVFVTYSVDPSSSDDQRIRVEWQVAEGLVLVLTQNGDNTFSADARWEASF